MVRKGFISILIVSVLLTLTSFQTDNKNLKVSEIKKILTSSSWKITQLWTKDYDAPENDPDKWIEAEWDDTKYESHFGIVQFQFMSNGTFVGKHYNGKEIKGDWTLKIKKDWTDFTLHYKAKIYDDDREEYHHDVRFQSLQISENSFIATGDICMDACFQKVKFEKVS